MRNDGPTLPKLGGYAPSAISDPDPDVSHETPTWPPAGERPGGAFASYRSPDGCVRASLLRASLGANVVLLIGALSLLLLNQTGAFASGGSTGPSTPGAILSTATALPSPTAISSVTSLSGWLQVTPTSVQLGCDGDQRT